MTVRAMQARRKSKSSRLLCSDHESLRPILPRNLQGSSSFAPQTKTSPHSYTETARQPDTLAISLAVDSGGAYGASSCFESRMRRIIWSLRSTLRGVRPNLAAISSLV